jgi:hypothetical protein
MEPLRNCEEMGWNREKSGGAVRSALHVYAPQYVCCLTFFLGYHQKNDSFYHGSYAWFLAILPGSYGASRRGPVTYETSPQEPLGYIIIYIRACMF